MFRQFVNRQFVTLTILQPIILQRTIYQHDNLPKRQFLNRQFFNHDNLPTRQFDNRQFYNHDNFQGQNIYWDFKAEIPQIWPKSGYFGLKIPIYGKNQNIKKMADVVFCLPLLNNLGEFQP